MHFTVKTNILTINKLSLSLMMTICLLSKYWLLWNKMAF